MASFQQLNLINRYSRKSIVLEQTKNDNKPTKWSRVFQQISENAVRTSLSTSQRRNTNFQFNLSWSESSESDSADSSINSSVISKDKQSINVNQSIRTSSKKRKSCIPSYIQESIQSGSPYLSPISPVQTCKKRKFASSQSSQLSQITEKENAHPIQSKKSEKEVTYTQIQQQPDVVHHDNRNEKEQVYQENQQVQSESEENYHQIEVEQEESEEESESEESEESEEEQDEVQSEIEESENEQEEDERDEIQQEIDSEDEQNSEKQDEIDGNEEESENEESEEEQDEVQSESEQSEDEESEDEQDEMEKESQSEDEQFEQEHDQVNENEDESENEESEEEQVETEQETESEDEQEDKSENIQKEKQNEIDEETESEDEQIEEEQFENVTDKESVEMHEKFDDDKQLETEVSPQVDDRLKMTPEIETPEMETPELETQEMETPEIEAPEMETPKEMETQEMETAGIETNEIRKKPSVEKKTRKRRPLNLIQNISVPSQVDEATGIRRSTRNRMPPMEYWRGQRPVYRRDSTGVTSKVTGVIDPPEPERKKRKITKTNNKRKVSQSKKVDFFNLSIHATDMDDLVKKNKKNKKQRQNVELIKSMGEMKWKDSKECGESVQLSIVEKMKEKGEVHGYLKLTSLALKKTQRTGPYTTRFTVIKGALALQIEENPRVIIKTSDFFRIPKETHYSLQNLRKEDAHLYFVVSKDD